MNVLFVCPHGAAKSVVAAAMFLDHSSRSGIDVKVRNAGTEPDNEVNPQALKLLEKRGLPIPMSSPRSVTSEDIRWADTVVSFGCAPDSLPGEPSQFVDWSDAPAVSDDPEGFISYVEGKLTEPPR